MAALRIEAFRPIGIRPADLLVAGGVALFVALSIDVATEEGARPADAYAYAIGALTGPIFLLRRRFPVAVLFAAVFLHYLYHSMGYPGGPTLVPVWVALFFVALAGRRNTALAVGAASALLGLVYRVIEENASVFDIKIVVDPAMVIAMVMLGDAIHARRLLAAEVQERLQQAERERHEHARRSAEQERLRIARELHDILAHTLTAVGVQASVAADLLDRDPGRARASIEAIRLGVREAMADVRSTVGLLRNGERADAPLAPPPGLGDLDHVVESTREAGLSVSTDVQGDPRPLPASVDLVAFRVAQEALTNVVKHAKARSAAVLIRYEPDALVLEVSDDGQGRREDRDGFGVKGMRERVEAIGGRLEVTSKRARGLRVHAWMPTRPGTP